MRSLVHLCHRAFSCTQFPLRGETKARGFDFLVSKSQLLVNICFGNLIFNVREFTISTDSWLSMKRNDWPLGHKDGYSSSPHKKYFYEVHPLLFVI